MLHKEIEKKAVEMRKKGMKKHEILKELKMGPNRLNRILKENNINFKLKCGRK